MRVFLLFVFSAGMIQAITVPAEIDYAKIEEGMPVTGPHTPFIPVAHIIPVDSSLNQYSMWTQIHECLAYNPFDGYLQFVCRTFGLGGNVSVWQADANFDSTVKDVLVTGSSRYPNSIASRDGQGPHISGAGLIGGAWGVMIAQYERGGWFSSIWDDPVAISGDVDAHKCIGKQLPNGNIIFVGVTTNWEVLYRTYTPALDSQIASGVIAPANSYYWGYDINGGIAYVFYHDNSFNIYYRTSTDGINWSPAQTYNMIWPEPYDSNVICWKQMAVTDAGNPILVFDNINGADNQYPFEGKIYVSIASGQPCIEVGITTTGAENFYPTIATGGNYVVVLFGEPRYGTGENTFWDIYYNYSMDNGISWHTPRSLTSNITDHNNCLWQIAKRLDPSGYGQFFFAFGCGLANPLSDLYYLAGSNISAPSRWYVGRNPVFGIAENKNVNSRDYLFKIMPNPAVDGLKVKFALARYGHVRIDIYDATGLLIRNLVNSNFDKGNHTLEIDLNDDHAFSNGVYFVKMHTSNYEKLEKLVIVR